jgi:hypothetical protein
MKIELPIVARVRNGPRFADIDAPVVHVAGATEAPLQVKPRKVKAKAVPSALPEVPATPWVPPTEAEQAAMGLGRRAPTAEPIEPAAIPAPQTVASVKFLITRQDKAGLRALGFTAGQIAQLTPQDVQEILFPNPIPAPVEPAAEEIPAPADEPSEPFEDIALDVLATTLALASSPFAAADWWWKPLPPEPYEPSPDIVGYPASETDSALPAEDIPADLLAAIDARSERSAATTPISEPSVAPPPPGGNGSNAHRRHSSTSGSPHGNAGAPHGEVKATFIYFHPDHPPPHHYLLVEKRIDAAGKRNFWQYHWASGRWNVGVKGTYAERKIPYLLPELKAALAANPNVEVQLAEGEKDADTLHRLGFVATTNPGGARFWTDDLTAWLRVLGVRRIVIHEDHDRAGRERTAYLAPALSSFATVRVCCYLDVPGGPDAIGGEDLTYWIENLGHGREDLAARIAAAEPATAVSFTATPLTGREWLTRVLPEPELLLGHVLSKTARAIMNATTGIGKTNFAMAAFGHMSAGRNFLHWDCPRPRRTLYIDGEMSCRLFRDRIADVARRLGGPPEGAHFFSKEDVPGFAPLNTRDGQVAVWALIDEVERRSGQKLDAICFDSIMALLLGDMKEEDAWRDTLPLVRALTARHIGQFWVHHTGHDTSHGYGTKTREWQLDTVLHLDPLENASPDLVAFRLSFKKARERTPANRLDFADATITLSNDRWEGVIVSNARGKLNESLTRKFYEALIAAIASSGAPQTGPYPDASLDEWRTQCTAWGLLDPGKANSARALFSRHRLRLIAANWVACSEDLAWVLP